MGKDGWSAKPIQRLGSNQYRCLQKQYVKPISTQIQADPLSNSFSLVRLFRWSSSGRFGSVLVGPPAGPAAPCRLQPQFRIPKSISGIPAINSEIPEIVFASTINLEIPENNFGFQHSNLGFQGWYWGFPKVNFGLQKLSGVQNPKFIFGIQTWILASEIKLDSPNIPQTCPKAFNHFLDVLIELLNFLSRL